MDPLADMLTSIRNANMAINPSCSVPHSKLKENVAQILKEEGYISSYQVTGSGVIKRLEVALKYTGRKGVIDGIKKISTPGLRKYVGAGEMPRVLGGLGVAIVSTSQGVMSGASAREKKVGGEVLAHVW